MSSGTKPRPLSPVSHAEPQDIEDLFAFLKSVRGQIGDGDVDDELLASAAWALSSCDGGTALVIRGARGIEGSLGLLADRQPLSRTHFLRAIWLVVAPEALLTGHARSLVLSAMDFANRLGRPLIIEEFSNPDVFASRRTKEYGLRFSHIDGRVRFLCRHMRPTGVIFSNAPAVA